MNGHYPYAFRPRRKFQAGAATYALGAVVLTAVLLAACVAGSAEGGAAGATGGSAAMSSSSMDSAADIPAGGAMMGAASGAALSYDPKAKPLADPAALRGALAAGEPVIVVDVRTPEEYAAGHIQGAVNIPYDTIATRPPAADKAARVVVYCRSGHRSGIAAATLLGMGFSEVADMGPFAAWKGAVAAGN